MGEFQSANEAEELSQALATEQQQNNASQEAAATTTTETASDPAPRPEAEPEQPPTANSTPEEDGEESDSEVFDSSSGCSCSDDDNDNEGEDEHEEESPMESLLLLSTQSSPVSKNEVVSDHEDCDVPEAQQLKSQEHEAEAEAEARPAILEDKPSSQKQEEEVLDLTNIIVPEKFPSPRRSSPEKKRGRVTTADQAKFLTETQSQIHPIGDQTSPKRTRSD